jgi:hypothetical protein
MHMIDLLTDPQAWASLLTLTVMEIVLGVDNLVLLSVLADRLPPHQRQAARRLGLIGALSTRLLLLSAIAWIMQLTQPVLHLPWHVLSWRDLILAAGGLFLIYKATAEIHMGIEGEADHQGPAPRTVGFASTIAQIALIDIVFSLDSVITAVGMASHLAIMMTAVIITVALMMIASGPVARFIASHPTVKMLALSFLLLIGVTLLGDAFGAHLPKAYIYAAMGFSALVECLNYLARGKRRSSGLAEPGRDAHGAAHDRDPA